MSISDLALIVITAGGCTAVVTALAIWCLRRNRRGSIASQVVIVVVASVLAIVCSMVAVVIEMFVSPHDLTVMLWVAGVSAAMSIGAGWFVIRHSVRRSAAALVDSAASIGRGAIVEPGRLGWREFDVIALQLADTSERLASARAEVEKLDAARRQFFAWISHDLRTPLTGMRMMAEALDDGVAEDAADYARLIRTKVDTISGMVDDLFELSRLESGTFELNRELVALLDVVSDAVVDVRAAATRRQITIVQRGVDGHMVWADPLELTRAVTNLLSNGVRHAPAGSEILVSAHRRDDGHLVVSILDHGSGVDSRDLGRMFDVGWRAGDARTGEVGGGLGPGAGLGLAIVRGIAEAHGGSAHAEHVPDGFRLCMVLPVAGQ